MRKGIFSEGKNKLIVMAICALLVVAMCLAVGFSSIGARAKDIEDAPAYTGLTNFTLEAESREDSMKRANEFNWKELAMEGFTLLENKESALPLGDDVVNVNLFGKNWSNPAFGGGGSSSFSTSSGSGINAYKAMENAGFKFNPELKAFYDDTSRSGQTRPNYSYTTTTTMITAETPQSSYDSALKESLSDYDDAAIVMLSRTGGEGCDTSMVLTSGTEGRTDPDPETDIIEGEHYLRLDDNEKDLIDMAVDSVKTSNGKVILVINAAQPLELDDEDLAKVDAVMWVGLPGSTGFNALGYLLRGKLDDDTPVSPSGHTVDTWAKDFTAMPSYQNFSINGQPAVYEGREPGSTSGGTLVTPQGNAVLAESDRSQVASEVTYEEGIYVGYKYYETRAFEEDQADGATADKWYNDNVRYPFGYGLSYTTFAYTEVDFDTDALAPGLTMETAKDAMITATVTVKNTGEVAGKEVVQLYSSAPYTEGGIEKSHVELADIAKTALIQPGKTAHVTLSVPVQYLASYDWDDANGNEFKGYEIEAGDYDFIVASDSHGWFDAKATVTADTTTAVMTTKNLATGLKLEMDIDGKGDGNDNQLDFMSEGLQGEGIDEMSRADFEGTFPEAPTEEERTVNGTIMNAALAYGVYSAADPDGSEYDKDMPWYVASLPQGVSQRATALTGNESGIIKLIDLWDADSNSVDYDDERWTAFLNQFTYQQLMDFVENGKFKSEKVDAVGVPEGIHPDGPFGFVGQINGYGSARCYYVSPCVVAATFNEELVEKQGEILGEEGAWMGYNGIYAPGVNIHRTPFSGRNFEYYSEDAFLTGRMASVLTKGMQSKGVFPFLKHFALNDQETDRNGTTTWATEQAAREIYLRAFQMPVEENDAMGIMSAFNRVGTTWCGASYELLTNILRKEWGFKGIVVTDWYNGGYMNQEQMVRAGNDLSLGTTKNLTSVAKEHGIENVMTPTMVTALRNAAKNICYVTLRTCNMSKLVNYDDVLAADGNVYNLYSDANTVQIDFTSATFEGAFEGVEYVKTLSDTKSDHATNPVDLDPDIPDEYVSLENGVATVTIPAGTASEQWQLTVSLKHNGGYIGQSATVLVNYSDVSRTETLIGQLEDKIDSLESAIEATESAIGDLSASVSDNGKEIAALQTSLTALQAALDSANEAITAISTAQGSSDAAIQEAIDAIAAVNKALSDSNAALSGENAQLKEDIAAANDSIGAAIGISVACLVVVILGLGACIVLLIIKRKN